MFSSIKTSKVNKSVVTELTQKLGLGAENVIARLALTYSLEINPFLDIANIQDSGGKEYSAKVLFGDYIDYYIALIAVNYNIYKSDQNIQKYIKMHIDDGLHLIKSEIENKNNILGTDFLINIIEKGLNQT